jgi:hypothetical protein
MLQKLVIVKALGGKPLKRVLLHASETLAVVADPALLAEIETGIHRAVSFPRETVYDFDDRVFHALLLQWHEDKATKAETWEKLPLIEAFA